MDTPARKTGTAVTTSVDPEHTVYRGHLSRPYFRYYPTAHCPRHRTDNIVTVHSRNEVMDSFECQCCFEEVDFEEKAECDGMVRHPFCVACVCKQIVMDVTRGESETHCIMARACEGVFSRKTRDRVLNEADRRRAEREEIEQAIYAAGLEGFWKCPFCDFGAVCEEVEGGETEFWCRNESCQRTSCRCCGKEEHPGVDCDGTPEHVE